MKLVTLFRYYHYCEKCNQCMHLRLVLLTTAVSYCVSKHVQVMVAIVGVCYCSKALYMSATMLVHLLQWVHKLNIIHHILYAIMCTTELEAEGSSSTATTAATESIASSDVTATFTTSASSARSDWALRLSAAAGCQTDTPCAPCRRRFDRGTLLHTNLTSFIFQQTDNVWMWHVQSLMHIAVPTCRCCSFEHCLTQPVNAYSSTATALHSIDRSTRSACYSTISVVRCSNCQPLR
jgi:hypothetical protein